MSVNQIEGACQKNFAECGSENEQAKLVENIYDTGIIKLVPECNNYNGDNSNVIQFYQRFSLIEMC